MRLSTTNDMATGEVVDTAFVDNFVESDAVLYMILKKDGTESWEAHTGATTRRRFFARRACARRAPSLAGGRRRGGEREAERVSAPRDDCALGPPLFSHVTHCPGRRWGIRIGRSMVLQLRLQCEPCLSNAAQRSMLPAGSWA